MNHSPEELASIVVGYYYPTYDMSESLKLAIIFAENIIGFSPSEPEFEYSDQYGVNHEMNPRLLWIITLQHLKKLLYENPNV